MVATAHHQAIGLPGAGPVAIAWAEDRVIEAVELDGHPPARRPFVPAVQWHPEASDDPRLFQALVAAAQSTAPPGKADGDRPLDSRA